MVSRGHFLGFPGGAVLAIIYNFAYAEMGGIKGELASQVKIPGI